MPIPEDVVIIWPGNHGDIPSGWDRVTTLDGIFVKGTANGVNPNVTGGASAHTHTTSSHTHTLTAHTHTGTTATFSTLNVAIMYIPTAISGGTPAHSHTYTTGSVAGTSGSGSPSWSSVSGDPAYFDVIYVESDGTPLGFPEDSVVLMNTDNLPTGWSQHSGSKDKFLRGAATSGNGGGTGGGSHTHSGSSHNHTYPTHTHPTSTSSAHSTYILYQAVFYSIFRPAKPHSHTMTPTTGGSGTASSQTASHDAESHEPEFDTLFGIQRDSASADFLEGAICAWLGTLANIPVGWNLCDGTNSTPDLRGKFIKIADVGGDISDTGGNAGHTHGGTGGHTHTSTSHTHSVAAGVNSNVYAASNVAADSVKSDHDHGSSTSAATDPGLASDNQPTDTNSDTQPAFRTVAFIQSPGATAGLSINQFGANF